jgi:hypothetical protein
MPPSLCERVKSPLATQPLSDPAPVGRPSTPRGAGAPPTPAEAAWNGPSRVWGKGPDASGLICCDDPARLPLAHKELALLPVPAPAGPGVQATAPSSAAPLRTWV